MLTLINDEIVRLLSLRICNGEWEWFKKLNLNCINQNYLKLLENIQITYGTGNFHLQKMELINLKSTRRNNNDATSSVNIL